MQRLLLGVGLLAAGVCLDARPAAQARPQVVPPARPARAGLSSGTGVMGGTVVAADTGRPVRRVRVTLASADAAAVMLSVTTADDGHFKFTDLSAGTFTLVARRPGFIDSSFGEREPGSGHAGTPITLNDGQKIENLSLAIARGGVITGTVVDDRGEPEFGAQVTALRWSMQTGERTLAAAGGASTDDRGIYRVTGLLPGDYVISVTPAETPMNDQAAAMKKRLAEASATGAAATVDALRAAIEAVVAAAPSDPSKDAPSGYAPTYFPGTPLPSAAETVKLGVSEQRLGVDLALQLVPLTRISGLVTGAAGLGGSVQVVLTPTGTAVPLPGPRSTRISADGSFAFVGVPPGSYNLMASTGAGSMVEAKIASDKTLAAMTGKSNPSPDFSQSWATTDVVVDGQTLAPLLLGLEPGFTLPGRISYQGAGAPPDFSRMRVSIAPVSASSPERSAPVPPVSVDPSGQFSVVGIVPGHYRLTVSGTGAWSVATAVVGGRDVMDVPLEVRGGSDLGNVLVTLTDRITSLAGSLQDSTGQPTANYTVVAFPADRTLWLPRARRIQAVRPSLDGHYGFHGLPPGDYRIAVVPDVEPGEWYDPSWLTLVSQSAIALTLVDGQHATQDVRVR